MRNSGKIKCELRERERDERERERERGREGERELYFSRGLTYNLRAWKPVNKFRSF